MDYEKKCKNALNWIESIYSSMSSEQQMEAEGVFTELAESEDERIRKWCISHFKAAFRVTKNNVEYQEYLNNKVIPWLEKQGKQKETNLVEILKHFPRETELYSPLNGKLWLAEVDEEHGIITCYKHRLEEGCTRATLGQENTVSFYSNGTTGLPDCTTSKDCMLFLYDIEKQGEQEQLYIRFGEIPTGEKSKIYRGEIEVGIENGVSVYPAFKTNEGNIVLGLNLPITKTTLHTQQYLIEYDNRPCYLVKGDYIGKDTDGQPLINNITIIKKIDNYRVKEKIGNVDNQNYIKPANIDKSKFWEDDWLEKQGDTDKASYDDTEKI